MTVACNRSNQPIAKIIKRAFLIPTLTVALLTALLLTACTAQAQRSNTRGIFLNAHLTGTTMAFNGEDRR